MFCSRAEGFPCACIGLASFRCLWIASSCWRLTVDSCIDTKSKPHGPQIPTPHAVLSCPKLRSTCTLCNSLVYVTLETLLKSRNFSLSLQITSSFWRLIVDSCLGLNPTHVVLKFLWPHALLLFQKSRPTCGLRNVLLSLALAKIFQVQELQSFSTRSTRFRNTSQLLKLAGIWGHGAHVTGICRQLGRN